MITEAIILAGGLGTRLQSSVPDLPKCMAPVNGRPFLSYLIGYYKKQGITRFIFSLGYKHGTVEEFLHQEFEQNHALFSLSNSDNPPMSFVTSVEKEPLGTGGAVLKACALAHSVNVLAVNGDTFYAADIASLSAFHKSHSAHCTLTLKPMNDTDRYGVVDIDDSHRIRAFREKSWYAKSLINGGVYALSTAAFLEEGLPEKFSFEKDYLERLCAQRRMFANVQDRYFIDIGIPADYHRAQTELPKNI